ncbi:MAG: AAA family ATPase, partial [Clostridia bacterium]|nr:AAA family ATPase [Clostridia bacterium]
LMNALLMLSQMLDAHHGVAPMIIIDEYDVPIQQGHTRGFYDEVVAFMRNLFSGGFKDNKHLSHGYVTGVLCVAKESIFSEVNNLAVYSVLDEGFSEYFGFTHDEVKQIAAYYGASEKYDELCEWYDGYRFGESHIFNPWSIVNYFQRKCKLQAYWVSTSANDVVGEILASATEELYEKLNALLQGKTVLTYIDTGVIYPQIKNDTSSVYSFLLVTGYLTLVRSEPSLGDGYLCEVALPNKEIAYVFKKEIMDKLTGLIPQSTAISIQEALYTGDAANLQERLETLLLQSASYQDAAGELFYQGLMLGLTAIMDNRYYVTSNRESDERWYDLQLEPKDSGLPGILIELKAAKDVTEDELNALAQTALTQIEMCKYDTTMKAHGVRSILKYGVAFSGKQVKIARR